MAEPVAYLNGQFVPAEDLALPVHDAGLVQGVAVSEQLRTFGGQLFRLTAHLRRLRRSLQIVGLEQHVEIDRLAEVADELVRRNHPLLEAGDDLGLSLFVTPGPYATFVPPGAAAATVCLHTYPVPFHLWADTYQAGQPLVISDVRQVPPECWPAELKCRSRMHYYLADRQARRQDPRARALLLDQQGLISEASTANLVVYRRGEGFISPPRDKILPGISVAVLEELAAGLGVAFVHHPLAPDDLHAADEVILSSTTPCLLAVVSVDGRPIGDGRPGEQFRRALAAWSELVGVDIPAQARRFATRSPRGS